MSITEVKVLRVLLYSLAVLSALLCAVAVAQEPGLGTLARAVQMMGIPLVLALGSLLVSRRV